MKPHPHKIDRTKLDSSDGAEFLSVAEAAKLAWDRTLAFFSEKLKA